MNIQCFGCWTVFPADFAERETSTRKLICSGCADCAASVIPREEWTPEELAEVEAGTDLPSVEDVAEGIRYALEFHHRAHGIPVGTALADGEAKYRVESIPGADGVVTTTYGGQIAGRFRIVLSTGESFHVAIEEGDRVRPVTE